MRDLFRVWPSNLSTEQVNQITALALRQPDEQATIFSSNEAMQSVRACSIRWLDDPWLHSLLWPFVEQANRAFQVALNRQAEMQFVEYSAIKSDHYDWHHDVQWSGESGIDRKLSITVQLSGSDEYEGGNFEFDELKTNADFRSKGTVLVFPSYLRHKIHPVTAGTRRALVAWFFGPQWA